MCFSVCCKLIEFVMVDCNCGNFGQKHSLIMLLSGQSVPLINWIFGVVCNQFLLLGSRRFYRWLSFSWLCFSGDVSSWKNFFQPFMSFVSVDLYVVFP